MIVRIRRRTLYLIAALMLIIPVAIAADVSRSFNVLLTVGNNRPKIFQVIATAATDPVENGTVTVYVLFNATDPDGNNLDDTTAGAQIFLNGVYRLNSSRCNPVANYTNASTDDSTQYNCSVTFLYYNNASASWQVNVTVADINGNRTNDTSSSFTLNSLSAMRILDTSFDFGSVALGATAGAADNPFVINNTGNFDFNWVNLTGYDLHGVSDRSYSIPAQNFTVNVSANAIGLPLTNQTSVRLNAGPANNATLYHGAPGGVANQSLWLYVVMPSAGIISQQYNATAEWVLTVS